MTKLSSSIFVGLGFFEAPPLIIYSNDSIFANIKLVFFSLVVGNNNRAGFVSSELM